TAAAALALHGAAYIALKTTGDLEERARRLVLQTWPVLLALTALSLIATIAVRPSLLDNYRTHPVALLIPAAVAISLIAVPLLSRRGRELAAFMASAVYLAAMLAGAAAALHPNLLVSIDEPS